MPASVILDEDGMVRFQDENGAALPEHIVAIAKKQAGDQIRAFLQGKCDEMSEEVEAIANLHRDTPDPSVAPQFTPVEFLVEPPFPPTPQRLGLLEKIFRARRERVQSRNAEALRKHQEALVEWEQVKADHVAEQRGRREFIQQRIYNEVDAMEDYLEEVLQDISWPRETDVSAEIANDGQSAHLDVDLPEVEDMPEAVYVMPQRGFKLSRKALNPTQRQKAYMGHIHSIIFRLSGETFAALPRAKEVFISGFSQRRDKATGRESDDYLLAVHISREAWEAVDFSSEGLRGLDVVEALCRFDLRRSMSKTGVFKPIQPFDPPAQELSSAPQ